MVNISCWAQQRKAIYTMPFLIEKQLFEPKARFQHTYSTTVHWTPPIAPFASRIKALIFCGFGGRKPFAHPSWDWKRAVVDASQRPQNKLTPPSKLLKSQPSNDWVEKCSQGPFFRSPHNAERQAFSIRWKSVRVV